jgi:hypothetical protein
MSKCRRLVIASLYCVALPAQGEDLVDVAVSVVGGMNYPTHQPWSGIDLHVIPDNTKGMAPIGRINFGYHLFDLRPAGTLELGLAGTVPQEEAWVRVGVIGRLTMTVADYGLPISFGSPEEGTFGAPGLLPGGLIFTEMDYRWEDRETVLRDLVIGIRGGVGSIASSSWCETEDTGLVEEAEDGSILGVEATGYECQRWMPGFIGGFYSRLRFKGNVYVEVELGTGPWVGIGYVF